jgi:hypothetical protein
MLWYLYIWIISDVTLFGSIFSGYTPYQYAASAETLTPVQLTQVPVDHIVGPLNIMYISIVFTFTQVKYDEDCPDYILAKNRC